MSDFELFWGYMKLLRQRSFERGEVKWKQQERDPSVNRE